MLNLHFQEFLHIGQWWNTEQIRWVIFHFEIFLNLSIIKNIQLDLDLAKPLPYGKYEFFSQYHSKWFVDVKFFGSKESKQERIVSSGVWYVFVLNYSFRQQCQLFCTSLLILWKFPFSLFHPFFIWKSFKTSKKSIKICKSTLLQPMNSSKNPNNLTYDVTLSQWPLFLT